MHLLLAVFLVALSQESVKPTPIPPLDRVLSASEFRKYQGEDKYHDRVEILRKAFERQQEALGPLIRKKDLGPAYQALAALEALCNAASDESELEQDPGELRHKEVKRLEIVVRKMLEELEDLKLAVSFREREPFERAGVALSQLREILLRQLFASGLGEGRGPLMLRDADSQSWTGSPASVSAAPKQEALARIDHFTVAEFEMIRLARTVVHRTEAFLIVCERRLIEIERRRAGDPWDKEEPNPLELHSYGDMLHAYKRAMDSLMINIDEKATEQTEESKEIRKALERLSEKGREFAPRLEALEDLVLQYQDPELARQLRLAMRSNAQAVRGAQFGLGAPPE